MADHAAELQEPEQALPSPSSSEQAGEPAAAPTSAQAMPGSASPEAAATASEQPGASQPGDEQPAAKPETPAQPPLAGQRIRIGSQRYGQQPRPAQQQSQGQGQPRPPQRPPAAGPGGGQPRQRGPQRVPDLTGAPVKAVDRHVVAPPPEPAPQAQREGSAPPAAAAPPNVADEAVAVAAMQTPAAAPYVPQNRGRTPVPNRREELSGDELAEFEAALGEVSLDDALKGGTTGAEEAPLQNDTRVRGRVIQVHRDEVFVDLGGKRQGVISLMSFNEPPTAGMPLEAVVARRDRDDGLYELVLPGGAIKVEDWSQVSEGMVVEARVTGHNKGGLECEVGGLRGFIPAGQVSLYRVEDLSTLVSERLACVVTEANPDKRNLVLSHRAMLERQRAAQREELLSALEVGQIREGVVTRLQDFGAFVDLGGVDGLIHVTQLSWDRIKHPKEVLEVGQRIKVRVAKLDATGKIGLAFRDLADNPWEKAAMRYPAKARVTGTVSKITEFGAFVRLEAGVEGLVHISEISHKRVFRVTDVLSEGQSVEVQVLNVDPESQRISLSMKALEARPMPAKSNAAAEPDEPEPAPAPVRKSNKPLKGGVGRDSGGGAFGLKW